MKKHIIISLTCCFLTSISNISAEIKLSDTFSIKGDARTGYFSKSREDRNTSVNSTDEFRLRLRIGLETKLSEQWYAKARWAGRYSTDEKNENNYEFFESVPSTDGLRAGDSTIDEIYIGFKPSEQWKVKLGRMQTKFELDGVAKKSLSRNDSPNTDITWTDGLYAIYKGNNGWNLHTIIQYNSDEGASAVRRKPLNFSETGSRLTYYTGIENKRKLGPIVQRGFDISYLPDSLRKDGTASGEIESYWAIVGRMAAAWPIGKKQTKFLIGLELGYAPNTPTEASKSIGASDNTDGFAGQVTFNLVNFVPKHSVGLVIGRAGAGYLISPDFRENTNLLELRYKWAIDKKQKIEARIRRREDIDQVTNSLQKREDTDFYLRYTRKF